jgi:hypothetical protein
VLYQLCLSTTQFSTTIWRATKLLEWHPYKDDWKPLLTESNMLRRLTMAYHLLLLPQAVRRRYVVAFVRQFQKISLRGRTNAINLSCFCSPIPKFFAARPNRYSQFELLLFANSKVFSCAAEQIQLIWVDFVRLFQSFSLGPNKYCRPIPKTFAAWPNKYSQFEWLLFAYSKVFRCATNTVNLSCFCSLIS